ncbi:MAG: O-antigen ligase family protein [Hyphomonadaceae bacterium]|nr:O-antigen ligase family protein [Hyphomonadaceae bacterium]
MLEAASPSLPPAVLYPATVLLLVLLARAMGKTPHASGKLLLAIIWLRFVMQAYHEITFTSVGGVSINALASVTVCGIGGIVLFRQLPQLGRFPILLTLVVVIAISGLANGVLMPTIETIVKWGYFAVVLLAIQDCIRRDGDTRILGLLLWSFAPPLVFQLLSFALGVGKATETDGSVSYVGGYNHESAFSIVLVTCFAVASLVPRLSPVARLTLLGACLVGIFAANYRTSLIALAPIAFGYFVFGAARSAGRDRRVLVSLLGLLVMCGAIVAANVMMGDRLTDLGAVASGSGDLIRPPEEFTEAERKLMSGRLYLWNAYIAEYRAGSDVQLLLGNGADSWIEVFGLYAHNTVVSYLYEFGIAGTALIIMVWLAMIIRAFRISDWALRGQLVCCHIGFILLNMATMPFWQVEGLILYGLLAGYTYSASLASVAPAPRPVMRRGTAPPRGRRLVARHPRTNLRTDPAGQEPQS